MAVFTLYYRCTVDMINDLKFKKFYQKYAKDVYPIYWMWHAILTEATKNGGDFNQGEDTPHDDMSLMAIFDLVGATHGLDFIKTIINEFTSKEFRLLSVDDQGLMRVQNWDKYQHTSLSSERVGKHRDKMKHEAVVTEILELFNKLTGKNLRTSTEGYRKMVRGRLEEGFTKEDFKKVIIWKIQQWGGKKDMAIYIRPDTLFRPMHFDTYLNEIPKNNPLTMLDVQAQEQTVTEKAQQPTTPDNAIFPVTDIYGRRRIVTQEQFDQAESGYFTKV